LVLGLVGSASAYDVGIVLKCDAEGTAEQFITEGGWTRVLSGLNYDVNSTGLNVTLATGAPIAIEPRGPDDYDRDPCPECLTGPFADVERDWYFANDENKSPWNDFILTLSNLQDGAYRLISYHNRVDETPVPIPKVTVTGAASVISVPPIIIQDHNVMLIPAETLFTSSGGDDIVIRFKGPDFGGGESGQAYLNGFILEYFGAKNQVAYDPDPPDQSENLCSGQQLSWTASDDAVSHDIYFSTDFDDVNEGSSPTVPGHGSTTWNPGSLEMGTQYYWRIDEDDGFNTWMGAIWRFTTNDGNAFDPFPADGWRGVDPNLVLSWSAGCLANSHDVYLGTSYTDVENANTWSAEFKENRSEPNYDPGGLDTYETYYWRIDEVGTSETWEGEVWSFKTGEARVAMYYKFDGVPGASIPPTLPDDTGSVIFTRHLGTGSLEYGESNPVINEASGTSASFDPNVGMYRLDTGDNDSLRLDGYQYTIEMWMKANTIPDIDDRDENGAVLFGKHGLGEDDGELVEEDESSTCYSIELRVDRGLEFFHHGNETDRQCMRVSTGRNVIKENEWYHIAAVFDLSDETGSQKLYLDGRLLANSAVPFQNPPDDANAVSIGFAAMNVADSNFGHYFDGLIDELRVQTVALEPKDFLLVPGPEWARDPNPAHRQTRVDPNVVLEWVPGISADSHDVYIGTAYDDVKDANTADDEFLDNVEPNSYYPGPLDYGTTYHWRVDEIGSMWKGVVWQFRTRGYIDDPNLILYYEFDETEGYEAFDSSGHDYIGDVDGDEDGWDPNDRYPYDDDGGCRVFDNDTSVIVEPDMLGNIFSEISISVWLKDAYRSDDDNWVFDCGGSDIDLQASVVNEEGKVYWRAGLESDWLTWDLGGANPQTIEGWHHWVFRKSESADTISIYFDGELADSNTGVSDTLMYVRNTVFKIGAEGTSDSDFEGKMDDFRIYDYALSKTEIELLFRGGDLVSAWGPKPFDGESDVLHTVSLIWKPGNYAVSHDVYFGTDFDDVNEADTSSSVFVDNRKPNEYDPPGNLALGTTYYWRIDEVNDANVDSPWKGKVWRFMVASFIVVDDMESYCKGFGCTNKIYDTWLDGFAWPPINYSGAEVALGIDPYEPVHRGKQSMVYVYQNDGGPWGDLDYYSEVEREFDDPCDWTEGGVKILTLYFYGDANNDANATEQMYVGLEDSSGAGSYAQVDYGTYYADEDMNDIKKDEWQQWDIALAEFSGVELGAVKKVYIGFGIRGNPNPDGVPGGSGTVYFDDVRVYLPKCVPYRLKPEGDLTDDCIVDFKDVAKMAREWLRTDACLPTEEPPSGPVGWWKFDEGSGTTANDSSASGIHDGTISGDVFWVEGKIGPFALEFDGGKVLVADSAALRPQTEVSACAWVKYSDTQDNSNRVVVKGADNKETFAIEVGGDDEVGFYVRDVNGNNFAVNEDIWQGEWVHLAGTFDGDTNTVKGYINGQVADSRDDANFVTGGKTLSQDTNDLAMGNRSDANNRAFEGTVDDVRVYNYALTEAQVAYIASEGSGYIPLPSMVNLFDKEPAGEKAINFRDYAVLMENWLDEKLWPPAP